MCVWGVHGRKERTDPVHNDRATREADEVAAALPEADVVLEGQEVKHNMKDGDEVPVGQPCR